MGYAAVLGSRWRSGTWDESWEGPHITSKEMFPIVLALEVFHTDNMAVAEIINKQTSQDITIMILVRQLGRSDALQRFIPC